MVFDDGALRVIFSYFEHDDLCNALCLVNSQWAENAFHTDLWHNAQLAAKQYFLAGTRSHGKLQILFLNHLGKALKDRELSQILPQFSCLKELDLSTNFNISSACLVELLDNHGMVFEKLTRLSLSGTSLSHAVIRKLLDLCSHSLEYLDLRECKFFIETLFVSTYGKPEVLYMQKLKTLKIGNYIKQWKKRIADIVFKSCPELNTFVYENTGLLQKKINFLVSAHFVTPFLTDYPKNLKEISLFRVHGIKLHSLFQTILENYPTIEILRIKQCPSNEQISASQTSDLNSKLPYLRVLDLTCDAYTKFFPLAQSDSYLHLLACKLRELHVTRTSRNALLYANATTYFPMDFDATGNKPAVMHIDDQLQLMKVANCMRHLKAASLSMVDVPLNVVAHIINHATELERVQLTTTNIGLDEAKQLLGKKLGDGTVIGQIDVLSQTNPQVLNK